MFHFSHKLVFIDFQFPSYTFPEEGGVQMVCLVASRPLLADTMVNIVSSPGTATGMQTTEEFANMCI